MAHQQALAYEIRRRDAKRSPGTDVPADTGGGLFSDETRQRDLDDVIADTRRDEAASAATPANVTLANVSKGDRVVLARARHGNVRGKTGIVDKTVKSRGLIVVRLPDGSRYDAKPESLDYAPGVREPGDDYDGTPPSDAQLAREAAAVPEVRDAQGRLLAPNGQPSNLDERQWRQVRTPRFIRWFGDWVRAAHRQFLEGEAIAQAKGDEFGPSAGAIVDAVTERYQREYGGVVDVPDAGQVTLDRRAVKTHSAIGPSAPVSQHSAWSRMS